MYTQRYTVHTRIAQQRKPQLQILDWTAYTHGMDERFENKFGKGSNYLVCVKLHHPRVKVSINSVILLWASLYIPACCECTRVLCALPDACSQAPPELDSCAPLSSLPPPRNSPTTFIPAKKTSDCARITYTISPVILNVTVKCSFNRALYPKRTPPCDAKVLLRGFKDLGAH